MKNFFEKTMKMFYATFDKRYEELLEQMSVLQFLLDNNITSKGQYFNMMLKEHVDDAMAKYNHSYKDTMEAIRNSHKFDEIQSVVDYEWIPVQEMLGDNFNRTDVEQKLTMVLDEIDSY